MEQILVPRCVVPRDPKLVAIELHNFSDASTVGYSTCAYVRVVFVDGVCVVFVDGVAKCCLLVGKSRVSPLKRVFIPHLELVAAVLAVKMRTMIYHEVDITFSKVYFWTDALVVLRQGWPIFHLPCANFLLYGFRCATISINPGTSISLPCRVCLQKQKFVRGCKLRVITTRLQCATLWRHSLATPVLRYLRNASTRFLMFVASRVELLHTLTAIEQWRYVPGELNPADIASRGISLDKIKCADMWFNRLFFFCATRQNGQNNQCS